MVSEIENAILYWLFILQVSNLKFELVFLKKKTKIAHKPAFAWSCDFLVLSIEFAIKNYIESWGQNLRRAKISKLELGPGVEDAHSWPYKF